MDQAALIFGAIGPWEIVVIVVVGLILFGRRLPEVGRSLGRGIVEFKRGLRDIEDDVDKAGDPAKNAPAGEPKKSEGK